MTNVQKFNQKTYCILGLSTFGSRTALKLAELGVQVLVVDGNEAKIQKIAPFVAKAVQADLLDTEILVSLGVTEIDIAILGLKDRFDIAVLLVQFLHNSGVKEIIVQVDSNEKEQVMNQLGASLVVFPESDSAERIVQHFIFPNVAEMIPLGTDSAIIEVNAPDNFIGKSIAELDIRKKFDVYVIGIKNSKKNLTGNSNVIVAPSPKTVFKPGDIIYLLGLSKNLEKFTTTVSNSKK